MLGVVFLIKRAPVADGTGGLHGKHWSSWTLETNFAPLEFPFSSKLNRLKDIGEPRPREAVISNRGEVVPQDIQRILLLGGRRESGNPLADPFFRYFDIRSRFSFSEKLPQRLAVTVQAFLGCFHTNVSLFYQLDHPTHFVQVRTTTHRFT